ncbi:DUF2247 family protein [Bacillus cereus]
MYKTEMLKRNQLDCNWNTLLIGRQYKLISPEEVTNYAVEYLECNPHLNHKFTLDLAWDITEDEVDDLLEKVVSDHSPEALAKEYHKWLYSILREVYHGTPDENAFQEIENVFFMFHTPTIMQEVFRRISNIYYYPSHSKKTIKELLKEFLEDEKKRINGEGEV